MKRLILLLYFFSHYTLSATVTPSECIKRDNDAGDVMYVVMTRDLKIDDSVFNMQKTKAEIISITPVNQKLAIIYGEEEHRRDEPNSNMVTTPEEYAEGFMQDNAKNIIVKYTYEDKQGRQNILLSLQPLSVMLSVLLDLMATLSLSESFKLILIAG